MSCLVFTYSDWQARVVAPLRARFDADGTGVVWIGRRSEPVASPGIRGVQRPFSLKGFAPFEASGPLPLLDDPIGFEAAFLRDYLYQMARYSQGYATQPHSLVRYHEYRDHFHLTARRIKRMLLREGVTYLLFFNMPHTGDDYLLYRVAEAMGLKVTILFNALFEHRFFSTPSIEAFGRLNRTNPAPPDLSVSMDQFDGQLTKSVQSYMYGTYRREKMRLRERLFAITTLAIRAPGLMLQPRAFARAQTETVRLLRSLKNARRTRREIGWHRKARNFLGWIGNLEKDPAALPERFVYVPLHFQPEMTTEPQGGGYGDQALAIEMLCACLPEGMQVVVKENPMQGGYHRERTFTDRLAQLEQVTVAHPTMDNKLLEARADIVATICGTAGWEAIRDARPCLFFGLPWYRDCPGAHAFAPGMDLQTVIDTPPDRATSEAFLQEAMAKSHQGVVYEFFLRNKEPAYEAANFETLADLVVDLMNGRQATTFA